MQLADKICRKLYYTHSGNPLYDVNAYKLMQPQQLSELMLKWRIRVADSLFPLPIDPETVLSYSIRAANIELVEYLCLDAKKEDLNQVRSYWSIERDLSLYTDQNYSLVTLCLSHPFDKDALPRRIAILKILLMKGANPNGLKSHPLLSAVNPAINSVLAKNAHLEASLLCEYGADLSHLSPPQKHRLTKALWCSYGKTLTLQTSLPFCTDLLKHIQRIFLAVVAPRLV